MIYTHKKCSKLSVCTENGIKNNHKIFIFINKTAEYCSLMQVKTERFKYYNNISWDNLVL